MPGPIVLLPLGLSLAATAASAATPAAPGRPGGFDPATTLPWAVPLLLAAPLIGYVVLLGAVRTRRAAANLALFVVGVMLVATLVVAWARFRDPQPHEVSFPWINIPVAFTGEQRFQGFAIDLAFRVDHYALAALVALLLVFLASLAWHRVAGRAEQGPVRFQVNALLFLLGAAGVVVSGNLAELLAFWLAAGIGTYLLLGHRWGTEGAGRRGQLALSVPFLGDAALLCAVALLYSRFGELKMDALYPLLTSTGGVGQKSLTAAALLAFGAIAARAGVWPFTAWQTGTVDGPPSALALTAGAWPILAGSVLLKILPVVGAAGVQAPRTAGYALAVGAAVGALLALVGVDARRSVVLASSGAVALALLGMLYPASTPAAFTGLLGVALGRAGGVLAVASAAGAMRTVDLRAMGGGWARMQLTASGLLVTLAAVALAGVTAGALRPRSLAWIAFGAGLGLVGLATFRVYFAVAHGPLVRRRAFDPERVRETDAVVAGAALGAGIAAVAALGLAFTTRWAAFLDPRRGSVLGGGAEVPWVGLLALTLAVAVALSAFAFWSWRGYGLAVTFRIGELYGVVWDQAGALFVRFFERPGRQIVTAVEGMALPALESGVGRALLAAGGLSDRRLPWVPTMLALAVVLAAALGLWSLRGRL